MAAIDLLLVGRNGNGKSSTGNSILKKKAFVPRSSSGSGTVEILKDSAVIAGRNITVVDGLGLSDTDSVKTAIDLSAKAMSMVPNGFNAFIICLKYGTRFTQQEKDLVKMVRSIFGENVIKKHGIIIMTYGDSFDLDNEDDGTTFDDWCKDQTGDVQDLFRECGNRYVLYNNRAKDNQHLDQQNKNLMSRIAEIHGKYTRDDYERAEFDRRKIIVKSKLPQLERRTTEFVDRNTQRVRKVDDNYYTPRDKMLELKNIEHEIINFKKQLDHEDEGTQSIAHLLLQISVLESTIRTKTKWTNLEPNRPVSQANNSSAENFAKNLIIGTFVIAGIFIFFVYMLFFNRSGNQREEE